MFQTIHKGNWIQTPLWIPEDAGKTRFVYFRRTLVLLTEPDVFPLRITATGMYKLFVNSELAWFGPMKGDGQLWFYDESDLAPFLHEGENVIAVLLMAAPVDKAIGNHSLFRFERPRLFIDGIAPDGWQCRVERRVQFPPEEERFAPLQIHECVAGDPEMSRWKEPAAKNGNIFNPDAAEWENAVLCPEHSLPAELHSEKLCPRPIPFMERKPHVFNLPVSVVPANREVTFVLDAGEEMCAFLHLETSGGKDAVVELLESEAYVLPEGKGDRCDSIRGHLEGYTDLYTVAGLAREVYEPFWFRTFRFLRITIKTGDVPLRLLGLRYEETGYPLRNKTSVTTSDESLSKIWDISLRTLRRCMHDTYMDCPFYEQLQYTMDTRAEILYTYAVSADDQLAKQAIDDFRRAQRPDGLLNCSYPNVNVNVIPTFSIYYILMVHDHMMYFGDRELVRKNLPVIRRILEFFRTHLTGDGLVDKIGGVNGKALFWSFIDWAEDWMKTEGMPTAGLYGPITMESLLYLMGLQKAAELCSWVNDPEEETFRQQAAALKAAIRAHCMNEEGMLADGPVDGLVDEPMNSFINSLRDDSIDDADTDRPYRVHLSQHCQVYGILTGVLTKEEGRRNLLRTLTEPGIAQCTVATSFYLFRALEATGLYDWTDKYWDIWRKMLKNNCTTCVEGEYYPRSECHAWGALALYELPSTVLGVRPGSPGYETIIVDPKPGYLTFATGTVHTPKGDIQVSWRSVDGDLQKDIDCEPELKARIVCGGES